MTVELLIAPNGSPEEDSSLHTPVQERLESIAATDDTDEQLARILWVKQGLLGWPKGGPMETGFYQEDEPMVELRSRLVDFALDPKSSPSVLVRVTALESAIELGYGRDLLPDKYTLSTLKLFGQLDYDSNGSKDGFAYRHIGEELVAAEGHDATIVFPELTDREIDSGTRDPGFNPVVAFEYLGRLQGELQAGTASEEALRFAPMIKELNDKLAVQAGLPRAPHMELRDWWMVHRCARLLRHGDEYRETFVDVIDDGEDAEFIGLDLLAEMSSMSAEVSQVFPRRYQKGVEKGLDHALADGLYALLQHARNGKQTHAGLELHGGGKPLSLDIQGDEHIELLGRLHNAFEELKGLRLVRRTGSDNPGQAVTAYIGGTIEVAQLKGAALLRLTKRGELTNTSVYIRPRGSETYDTRLEYGRPGEGVEASISFVVDTDIVPDRLPEVGKHRGKEDDGRISIRLDREGVAPGERGTDVERDPTRQDGTLSLDIGSVIGDESWTSTRIGRLLAWGNALRAGATGERVRLNHVTEYFSPEDGDADIFAAEAENVIAAMERERLSKVEIAAGISRVAKPVGRW